MSCFVQQIIFLGVNNWLLGEDGSKGKILNTKPLSLLRCTLVSQMWHQHPQHKNYHTAGSFLKTLILKIFENLNLFSK